MHADTVSILLIEDDDVYAEAVYRAFRKQRIANPIIRVTDGIEALDCLRGKNNQVATVQAPYIILVDINMPRMNGHEFLKEIREDERLRGSVVFVLTTSTAERDINQAYAKNVAGYILKAQAGSDFTDLVNLVEHYWRYVEFPRIDQ